MDLNESNPNCKNNNEKSYSTPPESPNGPPKMAPNQFNEYKQAQQNPRPNVNPKRSRSSSPWKYYQGSLTPVSLAREIHSKICERNISPSSTNNNSYGKYFVDRKEFPMESNACYTTNNVPNGYIPRVIKLPASPTTLRPFPADYEFSTYNMPQLRLGGGGGYPTMRNIDGQYYIPTRPVQNNVNLNKIYKVEPNLAKPAFVNSYDPEYKPYYRVKSPVSPNTGFRIPVNIKYPAGTAEGDKTYEATDFIEPDFEYAPCFEAYPPNWPNDTFDSGVIKSTMDKGMSGPSFYPNLTPVRIISPNAPKAPFDNSTNTNQGCLTGDSTDNEEFLQENGTDAQKVFVNTEVNTLTCHAAQQCDSFDNVLANPAINIESDELCIKRACDMQSHLSTLENTERARINADLTLFQQARRRLVEGTASISNC